MTSISRGFGGRCRDGVDPSRPSGRLSERGFPVRSAGPPPLTPAEERMFPIVTDGRA